MSGYARHVLVIEDDAETAEQLVDCLKSSGYEVDLAVDGEDGLRQALATDYIVMTVDRMLPRIDGIEIIRRLREEGIVTPALILSALGEVDDRVRGLRAGGDAHQDLGLLRAARAGPRARRRCPRPQPRQPAGLRGRRPRPHLAEARRRGGGSGAKRAQREAVPEKRAGCRSTLPRSTRPPPQRPQEGGDRPTTRPGREPSLTGPSP